MRNNPADANTRKIVVKNFTKLMKDTKVEIQ